MSGKVIHLPESTHTCSDLPTTTVYRPGTIWQCDDCNKQWVLVHGAQYNEPYLAWRPLTEKNRSGRDVF